MTTHAQTTPIRPRPAHRRSVRTAFIGVALVVLGACSSTSPPKASGAADRVATSTAHSTATTTATTTAPGSATGSLTPAGHTYGVGRADITLVDSSRGTDADTKNGVAAKDQRTLPVVLLYPTTTPSDDATDDDHPVAPGRFPLVVFSHGVTASGPAYVPLLRQAAAAGYVVALPTYPLTSGPKGWSNLGQTINQPADVSFIIDQLLKGSAQGTQRLNGHLDPDSIAVGGHSLGAITSLLFYNTCCRDRRVKAVVAISGITFPGKTDADSYDGAPEIPLLLLHGQKDKTLAYAGGSRKIFDTTLAKVPRALVSFPTKGHVDVLSSPTLAPAIVAFLDLELRGDPTRWRKLGALAAKNGDARVEVAGGLEAPEN